MEFHGRTNGQGLVNVLIEEHHPTIGDISSQTDIWFGDVKHIPQLSGHQSQPLENIDLLVQLVDRDW